MVGFIWGDFLYALYDEIMRFIGIYFAGWVFTPGLYWIF
jgi:hypothetical protein